MINKLAGGPPFFREERDDGVTRVTDLWIEMRCVWERERQRQRERDEREREREREIRDKRERERERRERGRERERERETRGQAGGSLGTDLGAVRVGPCDSAAEY